MDGGQREDRAGRIDEKREISSRRTRSGWEEEEEGQAGSMHVGVSLPSAHDSRA